MMKSSRLDTAWPVANAAMIGLGITLSAMLLFGPVKMLPETLSSLTARGASLFRPERDVMIYIAGCMLTCLLFVAFGWLQHKRMDRAAPDHNAGRQWTQMVVCGILSLFHLFILYVTRQLFPGEEPVASPLAATLCFLLPVVSLGIIVFDGWLPGLECPRWLCSRPGTDSAVAVAARHRWLDGAMMLFAVLAVYIPGYRELSGWIFLQEQFHHWDFYAMAPTLAFRHGGALGTDYYTQYSLGWPLVYNALSPVLPISYGNMIHISVIYGCVYFATVYLLLRTLLRDRVWAAAGCILAVALQLFCGLDTGDLLWRFPSSTIIRSPLDVPFFLCILLYARTARKLWVWMAAALAGAAILLETDTGIYLSVTLLAALVYSLSLAGRGGAAIRQRVIIALQCLGIALLVLLPGLWVAGRGTLFQGAFWMGWLESLITYQGGLGMLPLAGAPVPTQLFFVSVMALYLGTVGVVLVRLRERGNSADQVFLATLSTYGLATLLLFVGRSHPYNIFHVSVPFTIVAVATMARWYKTWSGQNQDPAKAPRVAVRLAPWASLAAAAWFLLANTQFLTYPGILQTVFSATRPTGLSLFKATGDVSGLPADAEGFVRMFEEVVERLKTISASGKTVSILDDADTIYYLAADIPVWPRYSPAFPTRINREAVAQLAGEVAERGTQVVVIRGNAAYAQVMGDAEVWSAVREAVAAHYRLDATVGIFEFWSRKE